MNIEELTIGEARQLAALFQAPKTECTDFWVPGKDYFLRTVTHHFTGKYVGFNGYELVFTSVAWIPDDGRFAAAMKSGDFSEVEPFPDGQSVAIGRASLIDATQISFGLPRSQR